ncbi:MAG: hypothetical protein KTU85_12840, partial [Acidimicrobiia bacterium]|nr:hypothetical protein [Acidimicrobiia bacterium]
MSLFSGSELFEVGTAGVSRVDSASPVQPSSSAAGGGTVGARRADSTLQGQPSTAGDDTVEALRTDSTSRVRPSTAGDETVEASRAENTSRARPSTTAGDDTVEPSRTEHTSRARPSTTAGDDTVGAARADSTSRVRPSTAGDETVEASRADSASRARPSTTAGDDTVGAARADNASRVQPSSAVGGCGTAGSVCVGLVDEVGLSDEGLRSRLKVLGRAESTLAAMKSRALAELSRRHNKRDAQRLIRDELQTSKHDAQRDVETATRLAELPATSGALDSGDIPVSHAQLIARAAGESPIDERLLVEAANNEPFDEFMQTVKLHQRDVAVDDGQSLLDRQRKK